MKKIVFILGSIAVLLGVALASSFVTKSQTQYEYLQITAVESVIPMGLGRSRMIATTPAGQLEEIKLENFFSGVGINFDNIRFNDKTMTDKFTQLTNEGWELMQVNSGVYSSVNSNGGSGQGIFITRYLFKRLQ